MIRDAVITPEQDQGVATPDQDEVMVLTVWLPITDATVENGCLAVVPGSHRRDLVTHCPGSGPDGGLQIPSKLIEGKPTPVPIKRGGALLMHRWLTKAMTFAGALICGISLLACPLDGLRSLGLSHAAATIQPAH